MNEDRAKLLEQARNQFDPQLWAFVRGEIGTQELREAFNQAMSLFEAPTLPPAPRP